MPDPVFGMDKTTTGRTAETVRRVLGTLPPTGRRTRRIPRASRGSGTGGTVDCGCCDGFNCVGVDQINIIGCEFCLNGATYKYYFNLGPWTAYPELIEAYLVHDSDCVWKSPTISVGGGVYQWVLTQADTATTLVLEYVSGTDALDLQGDVSIIYKPAGQWSCVCESKLEPYHSEKFPPNRTGLNMTVCLQPVDVPCSCCLVVTVDTTGLDPECADAAQTSAVLSVYDNCSGANGYEDPVCTFSSTDPECCDEDANVDGCWYVTYNRTTRELKVFHPNLRDVSGNPLYTTTLSEGDSICSIASVEVPFNSADYPSGYQCLGVDMPASVTVSTIDCDYGYGGSGGCGGPCAYIVIDNAGTLQWGFDTGGAGNCNAGCGCYGNNGEDLNALLGTPSPVGKTATLHCVRGLT